MKISRSLNLVQTIETSKGKLYIHSLPIEKSLFDKNYLVLSKTLIKMVNEGIGDIIGPRIAYLILKEIAEESGGWKTVSLPNGEVKLGVEDTLINLLLCNTFAYKADGTSKASLLELIKAKEIDSEDIDLLLGTIIFFILSVHIPKQEIGEAMLRSGSLHWGYVVSSLPITEYLKSLKTSIQQDNSGEKATA